MAAGGGITLARLGHALADAALEGLVLSHVKGSMLASASHSRCVAIAGWDPVTRLPRTGVPFAPIEPTA
jgi:hypothetical protein